MSTPNSRPVDPVKLEQAAAWRIALAERGIETSADFESWLAQDQNSAAWARVQAPWTFLSEHAAAPEMMAARRDALDYAHQQSRARYDRPRARWRTFAIAASLLLSVLCSGSYWYATSPDVYETGVGERRIVKLADGSSMTIDAGSLIKVWLERSARKVELLRGQARFDVAHDTSRPFSVHAGDRTVVATGTSFNVDLLGSRLLVTLIEGSVLVLPDRAGGPSARQGGAAPPQVRLSPGQQLMAVAMQGTEAQVSEVSVDKTTAWEAGELVADDERLGTIVERINRYSARPILIEDQSVRDLKISGIFKFDDSMTFTNAVSEYLPVIASTGPDGSIRLRRRP
jgi:transmembrane sensor